MARSLVNYVARYVTRHDSGGGGYEARSPMDALRLAERELRDTRARSLPFLVRIYRADEWAVSTFRRPAPALAFAIVGVPDNGRRDRREETDHA